MHGTMDRGHDGAEGGEGLNAAMGGLLRYVTGE